MIEFRHVSKVFDTREKKIEALSGINLKINKGDIFGVIGFSGAGKSTLIRTVNRLESPTSGEVIIEGKNLADLTERDLRDAKKKIGMIFQHFNLLNSKNVFENVAMPLVLSRKMKWKIEDRVYKLLEFVGLRDKANDYPHQLSGGQKQRVGIARALATNPSILLCDEATSALDPQTTKSILNLLKRINEEYSITILLITHEMEVVKEICNRVAVMEAGCVVETGSVFDVFANPQTNTARNFVQSVIDEKIPECVYELLKVRGGISRIVKIDFLGSNSGQTIVSKIAKLFNVELNVLFGNISELQGIPFGHLIIELTGDEAEMERALYFIENQNVIVTEVTKDGSERRPHLECLVGNAIHG